MVISRVIGYRYGEPIILLPMVKDIKLPYQSTMHVTNGKIDRSIIYFDLLSVFQNLVIRSLHRQETSSRYGYLPILFRSLKQ